MMDNGTKNYVSEYENEFGEPWVFEYNYDNDTGVLKGLDVGWIEYPVLEGRTFGLILDERKKRRGLR